METLNVRGAEDHGRHRAHAADEHVVPPDQETPKSDGKAGIGDEAVAENMLVTHRGNHFADDAHRWQDHDVHGRVRIEPEEVREEHRVASQFGIENADVHRPLRA